LPLAIGFILVLLLIARIPLFRKYLANLNISRRLRVIISNWVSRFRTHFDREESPSQGNKYSTKEMET
jgi:hypothetical protein